jgi:hypothetical protein
MQRVRLIVAALALLSSCDSRNLGPADGAASAGGATAAGGATGAAGQGGGSGGVSGTGGAAGGAGGATGGAGGYQACSSDADCGPSAFCPFPCSIPPGDRMVRICESILSGCPKNISYVCGCDGQTYQNDCFRQQARVALQHTGACDAPPTCGGLGGARCDTGQFCDYPDHSCGAADQAGTCVAVPTACDASIAPVCGCNGVTYQNDCLRQAAGVSKIAETDCPI